MLRRYYEKHGYNPDSGTPLPKTLSRLGIPEIGKRLAEDGPYPFWDGTAIVGSGYVPQGWYQRINDPIYRNRRRP